MPEKIPIVHQLQADNSKLIAQLNSAKRDLQRYKSSADVIGRQLKTTMIGFFAPAAAIGGLKTLGEAWDKQQKAIAQVETAIKSTGGVAGRTLDQLKKQATDLQRTTLFGDEEILQGATAQLLTFTNIANSEFDRTQKAILDVSTRLGQDLKSTSIQLGKALNDPIANLGALGRSGIQFSKEQTHMIKSLAETNRLAEAQNIILTELEKQYGGSAEAAAAAGLGGFQQLNNTLGDIKETLGELIFDKGGLNSLAIGLNKSLTEANTGETAFQRFVATIESLAIITNPAAAAQAHLRGEIEKTRVKLKAAQKEFTQDFERFTGKALDLSEALSNPVKILNEYKRGAAAFKEGSQKTEKSVTTLRSLNDQLKELSEQRLDATAGEIGRIDQQIEKLQERISNFGVTKKLPSPISGPERLGNLADLIAPSVDYDAILQQRTAFYGEVENATSRHIEKMMALNEQMNAIITDVARSSAAAFGEALGSGELNNLFSGILSIIGAGLTDMGKSLIAVGIGIEAFKKALSSLNGPAAIAAGIALVALGSAFRASASRMAGSLGGGGGSAGGRGSFQGNAIGQSEVQVALVGEWKVKGGDLYAVVKNQERMNKRNRA